MIDVLLVACVGLLMLLAFCAGAWVHHRAARWLSPVPTPREVLAAVAGEPGGPERDDDDPDESRVHL